jgi:hypothetical protein
MKISTAFRVSITFLLMSVIILLVGCAKKQRQFGTRYELENSFTMAFQNYGVYGATIDDDSYLMLVWVKGDFGAVYKENEKELQKLFRTWLDYLYQFKGADKAVGILIKQGSTDLFHASRDENGKYSFHTYEE